ncbi:IS1182-like element IS656 family transposase [Halalkalibacterium halodurans]|uniref:Transposase (07) n=5 Tax=Halalkalibacterium halodurans TaxID=86665 RepID=Q9JWQ1_HALH5|nr:IS1182-like element IS656 family transposase [Halalkalibacterium halodurans]MED4082008.1 IS1182-like element IS656 family transposase [Halalkalibacterium halodurans]MED4087162.1 IS1182-like element IS656 family transposase [Halalkalibacterium halodurans]MED4107161.1 IS1182-like element IS656 family transposase [Halalkalibacterium halodurans]MED4111069.1 IS1182-like element IS656 family transposase [Halalkalibacterium halodurans]MED4126409.1 IS1182-like element IS656 family transposase [Hala
MTIIRQMSLFSMQELYEMEPTQRYDAIFSAIDLSSIVHEVTKKSHLGAPEALNYPAMVISILIRLVEGIPTMKHLIKRLNEDLAFKRNCGFLVSDSVPSEASYSRLLTKLENSNILAEVQEKVILQAIAEGFITDDTVAIDATHFEARDQAPPKEEKPKEEPQKRGRKTKKEREQWLIEQAEKEANLPLFEKKIEAQLEVSLAQLRREIPQDPKWGIKKNSEGKNVFWYGYKGHLAVGTSSQYILQSLFSSGNLNDGKAAIPLLKGIHERLPLNSLRYQTMDAGYDFEPIYEQVYRMGQQSVIAYNKRNERERVGFDEHFAPTCVREHSYRYDSFDPKYETLKYTRPKECHDCPLANDGLCQKVYKVKITTDLRKYTAPARGSNVWKSIFKQRTAVERVNAYLKELFQLNNVRHRSGKRAKVHFDLVTLVYNASKLAVDRIRTSHQQQQAA